MVYSSHCIRKEIIRLKDFCNIYEREMKDLLAMMKLILLVDVLTHLENKEKNDDEEKEIKTSICCIKQCSNGIDFSIPCFSRRKSAKSRK
ncbi:hypothetical protein CN679_23945 [Bacillus pseudomycoides]|nr:hypothetical protein CN679_23945 [Bacillus pseudomycoides]